MTAAAGPVAALLARANEAAQEGRFSGAARLFEEVAAAERARGRDPAASTALRFASSMHRFAGEPGRAVGLARRAAAAPAGTAERVAALVELGEGLRQAGRDGEAVRAYREALDEGGRLGDDQRAAVHRRIAAILLRAGDAGAGLDELERARRLHARAGNAAEAAAAAVEAATVLVDGTDDVAADAALAASRAAASAAGDHRSLAQVALLEGARALRAGDSGAALAALADARDHALEGTDPVDFLAASLAIADLENGRGERVAAYRSLASAWVTLGDLLGREAGRAAVEPRLLALRSEWGPGEFATVKARHDAERRVGP